MRKLNLLLFLLIPLFGCQKINKDKGHTIYWIHMEGAPVRTLFDQWLDHHGLFKVNRPEVENQKSRHHGVETFFPKVWFKGKHPSSLLDNWVNIRGIETASPHLKEARMEWVYPLKEVQKKVSIKVSNSRLKEIYETLLEKTYTIEETSGQFPFRQWEKELDQNNSSEGSINLFILDGKQEKIVFESSPILSSDVLKSYNDFYRDLILNLENFVEGLKKRNQFQNSVILITSDRARIVTNQTVPLETTTLWQGLNFSLISGSITGPLSIGHVQKTHPQYSDSLPGTWGLALDPYGVKDFHLLVQELLDAPLYNRPGSKRAKNPWVNPKILQSLGLKLNPGRVF